ncbi:major facilitator superfamily domain-containing protein 9-like isoform X2 [Oratosquilla oratoria]|uniref:major facilitator superfamily domain-containing protein 9-like isoform X2 n=1 Tax=Oratosquilla oratoria TaxID=337810 RepID=UPI003F75BD92
MDVKNTQMLILVVGFLDLLGVSLILPQILPFLKFKGISPTVSGVFNSLYGGIQLCSSPTVGRWSDIWGRRPVMLVCLLATAISYIILGASQSILVMVLGRVVAGIFKHSQTIARALLADITPEKEHSLMFGRFNAASSMGFIIGPMLGGHLSEVEHGFFWVCLIGASFFILDFVLCWFYLPEIENVKKESTPKTEAENLGGFFTFVKEINWDIFGEIFMIRFLLSFSALVYRSNFSLLIDQNFGASPKIIGYLISFQGIISALAGFSTGAVSRYYGNSKQELFHSSVLLTTSLFLLTVAPSLTLLLLCLVPLCVGSAVIRVSTTSLIVSSCDPLQIGSVTGFSQSITSISRMMTPLIAGITQEISVYGPGLTGTFSAGVGAVLACILSRRTPKVKEE